MTNEQILKKAIEKAWDNGYKGCKRVTQWHYLIQKGTLESIIFSHNFAKAFFPKKENCECNAWNTSECACGKFNTGWKNNLQQMVILPDNERIKYLKKFL